MPLNMPRFGVTETRRERAVTSLTLLFVYLVMMNTNLTGVPRALRGHVKLKQLYEKILRLADKIPKEATYRTNLEAIICHKLSIVKQAGDDVREIEDNIACGRIEMLIAQAQEEFELLQKVLVWKPWEPLIQLPPPGQWDWPPVVP